MKADLTLPENRGAFILQYFGKNVVLDTELSMYVPLQIDYVPRMILYGSQLPLSLRHISSLTKEETNELAETMGWTINEEVTAEYDVNGYGGMWQFINGKRIKFLMFVDFPLDATDFLRSKSFLIPYRGNSCEELIEAGLAVYREENKQ